ncbi:MAG TPA: hypothetical protein PK089_07270 [Methanoregulaceae archaeon]|nr:hypothetical protein [Methanoregulaceae archaeon]HQJ87715.1 hypothetical protein [Methanoregulaceae archaeon]
MVVNQSQVDQILSAASEDDPEVKLQNLEREVDLIKTSIKRLLIDIRERLNDMDNPFTTEAISSSGRAAKESIRGDQADAHESALEAREAALDAREEALRTSSRERERDEENRQRHREEERHDDGDPLSPIDRQLLDALKAQLAGQIASTLSTTPPQTVPQVPPQSGPFPSKIASGTQPASFPSSVSSVAHVSLPRVESEHGDVRMPDRIQLQKAYRLFKWTNRAVKKYGHDRLETMLQSYRSMGYITREACDEVSEIARLMPSVLGEVHEIDPGEYVAELYVLNRILSPNDLTLDRDMIEVLMERRQQDSPPGEDTSREKARNDEWINLLDRI